MNRLALRTQANKALMVVVTLSSRTSIMPKRMVAQMAKIRATRRTVLRKTSNNNRQTRLATTLRNKLTIPKIAQLVKLARICPTKTPLTHS